MHSLVAEEDDGLVVRDLNTALDKLATTYNILQVNVDKVVERVEMLLDEPFDGQKGR